MERLKWKLPTGAPAPHEMRLHDIPEGGTRVILLLDKLPPLTLEGVFPTLLKSDFLVGWTSSGEGGWQQVDTFDDNGVYFCIRYVPTSATSFVVWRVDHRSGAAYDTLSYFTGSLDDMRAFYSRLTKE
jgi:hypothetical protein